MSLRKEGGVSIINLRLQPTATLGSTAPIMARSYAYRWGEDGLGGISDYYLDNVPSHA